jgi:hypothetical protein
LETVEAGRYVNFAKIRVPDPDSSKEKEEDFDADPALSILPAPRLDQKETVDMLAQVFEKVTGLRYLELDIRVATRVEGDSIVSFNPALSASVYCTNSISNLIAF